MIDPAVGEHCEIRARDIPEVTIDAEIRLPRYEARVKQGLQGTGLTKLRSLLSRTRLPPVSEGGCQKACETIMMGKAQDRSRGKEVEANVQFKSYNVTSNLSNAQATCSANNQTR